MNRFRKYILVIGLLKLMVVNSYAQSKPSIYDTWENGFTKSLQNTHDMALPAWGPYSNKYNGISNVPEQNNGFRFDVIVQPSFYLRNLTAVASVQRESGYHPWQASPDLSYFSYRYELEWKDKLFCDVSFSKVDERSRLIKAEFVNNTSGDKSLALNIFSSISFPYTKRIKAVLPDQVNWQEAAAYSDLTDSVKAFDYNLVYNGQLRGQINDDNAVSHTAIVIGKSPGETLSYHFLNNRNIRSGMVVFRYRTMRGGDTKLNITINGKPSGQVDLKNSKGYALTAIEINDLAAGNINLMLKTLNNTAVALDGFVLIKKNELPSIKFFDDNLNRVPKETPTDIPNAAIFKFDDIKEFYGLVWSDTAADIRDLFDDNPDQALAVFDNIEKRSGDNSAKKTISGNNKGWFKDIFSAPIVVKSGQTVSRYAYVVYGDDAKEVINKLRALNTKWNDAERIYKGQQSKVNFSGDNKAGRSFELSQQLMAATTLTNVIYPAFAGNKYIKHTTPGKRWSSFYTWDSGFIGLGYSALNEGRALESLNAYTMDASEQSAFLEHGTPLPVQGYLFNELWNKTQNAEFLKYFYPRLKRYYSFLGGAENSPTRKLKSNLIQTWDIFYNSGGWDDYSPQLFVHKEKLDKVVAPTVNTSHQIRFAKLLKMAAWQLGYKEDMKKYDSDIRMYSAALQKYSWDDKSGYFGYVKHDNEGNATGILNYATGANFNMGLDGCSPLIAGICTPAQKQKIIAHLFTKGQLWSDQGITAIDQTAPYYSKDGYWNGRVWMAHQWFIWKTMLDLNEPEKAIRIAQTALNVWKRETEDTYNCWENFSIETGNGGGWHQFGALSSPVLNWFASLYKPGTITFGFDVWPVNQKFSAQNDEFKGRFKLFADQNIRSATMIFCMNDKNEYQAKCNGKDIAIQKVFDGLYTLKIELGKYDSDTFNLELTKRN